MNKKVTYTVEVTFREEDSFGTKINMSNDLIDYTSTLMIDMLEFSDNITTRIEHIAITSDVTGKTFNQGEKYDLTNNNI